VTDSLTFTNIIKPISFIGLASAGAVEREKIFCDGDIVTPLRNRESEAAEF